MSGGSQRCCRGPCWHRGWTPALEAKWAEHDLCLYGGQPSLTEPGRAQLATVRWGQADGQSDQHCAVSLVRGGSGSRAAGAQNGVLVRAAPVV